MHRSVARTYTKRAQVAGAVLVMAAGAVAFLPASPHQVEPIKPDEVAPAGLSAAERRAALRMDADNATHKGSTLDKVAPPVQVATAAPMPGKGNGEPAKPPPPPPPPPLRYIGAIMTPSYKRAVLVQNDQQKLVGEGDKVEGSTVVEIASDYIKVKDDAGVEKQIDLAPRQPRALRIVGGGGGNAVAGTPPPPGSFQPVTSGMNAEIQAMENKAAEMEKSGDTASAEKMRAEIANMRGGANGKGGEVNAKEAARRRAKEGGDGGKGGK